LILTVHTVSECRSVGVLGNTRGLTPTHSDTVKITPTLRHEYKNQQPVFKLVISTPTRTPTDSDTAGGGAARAVLVGGRSNPSQAGVPLAHERLVAQRMNLGLGRRFCRRLR
jgi:hypothetical protein